MAWPRLHVCVVLAAIPAVLTFFYFPSFVHPISTLMMKDLVTFNGYDRRWVALDDVAPVLVRSVVMSEDGQFCWHRGIDWAELNGVIDDAMAGEMTRGASTITMQTVKNLYLWHRPLGTVRKVIELPLAFYFDAVLSKKRIIEIYLNIAEWGPGIYGIEAAAQHHFGKSAKSLTRQAGGAAGRDAAQSDRTRSRQARTRPEAAGRRSSRSARKRSAAMSLPE